MTKIKYDLPVNANVTIKVYDVLGREVTTLVKSEFEKAGRYEVLWNAVNFASRVYFYRIEAGLAPYGLIDKYFKTRHDRGIAPYKHFFSSLFFVN